MNRTIKQSFIVVALGLAFLAGPAPPLAAQTVPAAAAPLIARLHADAYDIVDTHRSWFGRVVILATRDGMLREVVVNRTTGAVLSDRLFPLGRMTEDPAGPAKGSGNGGNGPGDRGGSDDGHGAH